MFYHNVFPAKNLNQTQVYFFQENNLMEILFFWENSKNTKDII